MKTYFASHAETPDDLIGYETTFDPFRPAIELDGVRVNLDPDEHGFVVLGGPVACEHCEESVAVFANGLRAGRYMPPGVEPQCPHCMAVFPLLEGR